MAKAKATVVVATDRATNNNNPKPVDGQPDGNGPERLGEDYFSDAATSLFSGDFVAAFRLAKFGSIDAFVLPGRSLFIGGGKLWAADTATAEGQLSADVVERAIHWCGGVVLTD